ncbi:hypothetical protein V8G54_004998 [Vigna mungo]|uniref:Uncharacterized protein n=1 Tax=Vigna mungo TaxID=3915 RepID=A0AAQ3SBN7_VIGMU
MGWKKIEAKSELALTTIRKAHRERHGKRHDDTILLQEGRRIYTECMSEICGVEKKGIDKKEEKQKTTIKSIPKPMRGRNAYEYTENCCRILLSFNKKTIEEKPKENQPKDNQEDDKENKKPGLLYDQGCAALGVYGDNGSLVYHHGYGYAPYGPYSPAGSPVPTMGNDGQLYGPQHYQYPPYFQPLTPTSVPFTPTPAVLPQGEVSTSVAADQKTLPVEAANGNSNGVANGGNAKGNNSVAPVKQANQNSSYSSKASNERVAMPGRGPTSGYQDPRFGFDGVRSSIPWLDAPLYSDGQQGLFGLNLEVESGIMTNNKVVAMPSVVRVPECYVPHVATPRVPVTEDSGDFSVASDSSVTTGSDTDENKVNIRVSSIPPPRAVISSPGKFSCFSSDFVS